MSACNFSLPFSGTPDEILRKSRELMERKGGSFSGDDQKGSFEITIIGCTISGSYVVVAEALVIDIENKPFFIPCETVETYLRDRLC